MITPVDLDKLFKLNPNYEITSFDGNVLVIDNWYQNFDGIYGLLQNATVTKWKGEVEETRNFVDYYDCRLWMQNLYPAKNITECRVEIEKLIRKYFNVGNTQLNFANAEALDFNYFKYINPPNKKNYALNPHTDWNYGALIFMDKVNSGGTAIYDIIPEKRETLNADFDLNEDHIKIKFQPKSLVQSVPNRIMIFRPTEWHGAVLEDPKLYVDDWRITQVHFISSNNNNMEY